jgi:glyoxylase-like metal-dependent hydrolase (beta-lactamase superfamily II)
MSNAVPVTIVNVGYHSTNYWVISAGRSRLLLDLGYPGTLGMLLANLKRMDIPLQELRYGLATHYHIDHAGVAQELKQLGLPLLVLDRQVPAIPVMKKWTKPQDRYIDITTHDNITISFEQSRARLAEIGLAGEIISTPQHSDDSVSLLLDDGSVFTGDLPPWPMSAQDDTERVVTSWHLLWERGARSVYPGHGPIRPLEVV